MDEKSSAHGARETLRVSCTLRRMLHCIMDNAAPRQHGDAVSRWHEWPKVRLRAEERTLSCTSDARDE